VITDLGWTTLITPTVVTIPPGASVGVVSSVAVPQGTTAGTIGKTKLTFNGTPNAQTLIITDTTTTLLSPLATMVAPTVSDGGAGDTVQFCHTVKNLSNGVATFTLTGVSSLGSKISFISNTPGKQLVNGATFTVGNSPGTDIFNFCANVIVDIRALRGQHDLISIGMVDAQGAWSAGRACATRSMSCGARSRRACIWRSYSARPGARARIIRYALQVASHGRRQLLRMTCDLRQLRSQDPPDKHLVSLKTTCSRLG